MTGASNEVDAGVKTPYQLGMGVCHGCEFSMFNATTGLYKTKDAQLQRAAKKRPTEDELAFAIQLFAQPNQLRTDLDFIEKVGRSVARALHNLAVNDKTTTRQRPANIVGASSNP